MKIYVTGATGFLGNRTCLRLKTLGYEVVGVGRNIDKAQNLIESGIQFIRLDLSNRTKVFNSMKDVDYVVHCAALSSPWGKYKDFYRCNVVATKNIIDSSFKNRVKRVIHISTPGVYFDYRNRFNIKESEKLPKKMVNFYADTKLRAENIVNQAYKKGLETIILRPRAIFGAGDSAIIPRILKANDRFGIPFINSGNAFMDITYVDNVVEAIVQSIKANNKAVGETFNITNGEPIRFKKLVNFMFSKLNRDYKKLSVNFKIAYLLAFTLEKISIYFQNYKEPTLTRYSVGLLSKSMTLDINKARKLLNYKPKTTVLEGLDIYAKSLS